MMPAALLALALASFGIGTTEFVILGMLPEVAQDLSVSIPSAGMLVSAYALGVVIGGPLMAMLLSRMPRKTTLIMLMDVFVVGNIGCALAPNYELLMVARVITAFCHAAFFGVGAVAAASLVAPDRASRAISLMFTGLTLANVLGVPAGTLLGQLYGWRAAFWAVSIIGVVGMTALWRWMPARGRESLSGLMLQFRELRSRQVWIALGMAVLASTSMFTLFTYIAPLLRDVSGIKSSYISAVLVLYGVGVTAGNLLGGRLADWRLMPSLIGIFAVLVGVLVLLFMAAPVTAVAVAVVTLWGAVSFAAITPLQARVVSEAGTASQLASTMNISAFNLGNAVGAALGGAVIQFGWTLRSLPLIAAVMALLALLLTMYSASLGRTRRSAIPSTHAEVEIL